MDAATFRAELASQGYTLAGFARELGALGDYRTEAVRDRWVRRLAAGDSRVPGELVALLALLRAAQAATASPSKPAG